MKSSAYFICILLLYQQAVGQNKLNGYSNLRLSSYITFGGGWGFSGSAGGWIIFRENRSWQRQTSFSVSINFVNGRNLGNKNRYKQAYQVNTILSPMVTFGSKSTGLFEELHPFYFPGTSAVLANYQNSFTLGTTFIATPKAFGKNKSTFRNRAQQLGYLSFRLGNENRNIQFHAYEDFLASDYKLTQFLADNFDRYYTGGSNFQVRLNEKFKVSLYNEVYTGNFESDLFDYPDVYFGDNTDTKNIRHFNGLFKKLSWYRKYVFQEHGQKLLNASRTFLRFDMGSMNETKPFNQISLIAGVNDKRNWLQEWIHDHNPTSKITTTKKYQWNSLDSLSIQKYSIPEKLLLHDRESIKWQIFHNSMMPKTSDYTEGKHYFESVAPKRQFFVGAFTSFSIKPNISLSSK